MHTVELYRKVRLACRDGMSERAAARHFGISRESVKKMLCFSVPPGYRRTAPVRRPKLDGFTEIIDQWLKEDLKQLRKQRHTAKRIFDRLRAEHGFSGGYTIVKDYVREHHPPAAGDVRAADPSAGPWAGGLRRGACGDRGCGAQGALLRLRSAAQRRLLCAGLPCGDGRGVDRRACACLRLLRRGSAIGSLRQRPLPGIAHSWRTGRAGGHGSSTGSCRITSCAIATGARARGTTRARWRVWLVFPGATSWCRFRALPAGKRSIGGLKSSAAAARAISCAGTVRPSESA